MKSGAIQNDEFITRCVMEGKDFVVLCEDEKDANSKRVSLYNARRKLSVSEQKRVAVQKCKIGNDWVVKIFKPKSKVFQLVDGELVPLAEAAELSESSKQMLCEMLEQGMDEESIVEVLLQRNEEEESVRLEISRKKI